jgi:hypothetical protein
LLYAGAPAGDEFRVNTTTISRQIQPAIAAVSGVAGEGFGRFLTMWSSYAGQSGFDLVSQSYVVPTSQPPAGDGGGGGGVALDALNPAALTLGLAISTPVAGIGSTWRAPSRAPLQLDVTGPANGQSLRWNSEVGARYQLESSPDLKTWTALGEARTATTTTDSVKLDGRDSAAFFRVRQLP